PGSSAEMGNESLLVGFLGCIFLDDTTIFTSGGPES
ncbi:unnamed protein product, partial [marine sediment metagenome]